MTLICEHCGAHFASIRGLTGHNCATLDVNVEVIDGPAPMVTETCESEDFSEESGESSDPDSEHEQPKVPTWPEGRNYEVISKLIQRLQISDSNARVLIEMISQLDVTQPLPPSLAAIQKAEAAQQSMDMIVETVPIETPSDSSGNSMVERQSISLVRFDLMTLVHQLLSDPVHVEWFKCNYEPDRRKQGRGQVEVVSELWTARWWRDEELKLGDATVPAEAKRILSIILSGDETQVTLRGRMVHPVYLTLGNLYRTFRQKESGRKILGFIPIVNAVKSYKSNERVKSYKRQVKLWCMWRFVEPIIRHANGLVVQVGARHLFMYPRMPFFVGDEPEIAHAVINMYKSAQATYPCSRCLVNPKVHGLCNTGALRDIEKQRQLFFKHNCIPAKVCERTSMHP